MSRLTKNGKKKVSAYFVCQTIYRMSQELRSLFRVLIPELILSQKLCIHMGPIRNGSGVMSFKK